MLKMYDDQVGVAEIGRRLDRSASLISKKLRQAGRVDAAAPDKMAAAHKKNALTNAAKRAALETQYLDKAKALVDQIDEPHLVYNIGGKDNTYTEHLLHRPDTTAIRNLVNSSTMLVDRAIRLNELQQQQQDNSDVDLWLEHLTSVPTVKERPIHGQDADSDFDAPGSLEGPKNPGVDEPGVLVDRGEPADR